MNKAKEISALWSQIKPQIGELVRLCHEVESHYEVTADAYQRGYEAGLNDKKEGKATCQYCEYEYLDETEEPCKKCCKAYMNKYKPKAKKEQIQVGDEVIRHYKNEFMEGDDAPSIFLYEEDGHFRCLAFNGRSIMIAEYPKNQYRKTGRHFSEIAEVLQKMQES